MYVQPYRFILHLIVLQGFAHFWTTARISSHSGFKGFLRRTHEQQAPSMLFVCACLLQFVWLACAHQLQ